jgi:DNA-binding MarR family transcriptional regulator
MMDERPDGSLNADIARELMETFRQFKQVMRKPGHTSGMRSGEMAVMATVAFHQMETGEGIRVSEIGRMMKIAPPTVTQFINGLEKAGWVVRRMDAQDRRSVQVFLTEEGRRRHEYFETVMMNLFQGLSEYLGPEDAHSLNRIMKKTFTFMETTLVDNRMTAYSDALCGPPQEKETETTC